MTSPDTDRTADVLLAYAEHPMAAGDAVLLLDGAVCTEISGLADSWDDVLRSRLAELVRSTARNVVLAIARPGADLLPSDYRLWRELHQELRGSDVDLAPVKALPSARA